MKIIGASMTLVVVLAIVGRAAAQAPSTPPGGSYQRIPTPKYAEGRLVGW